LISHIPTPLSISSPDQQQTPVHVSVFQQVEWETVLGQSNFPKPYQITSPKYWGKSGFSSTLILQNLDLPSHSSDNLSYIGKTIVHRPHQGAQKSTSVGRSDFKTSSPKV